MVWLLTKFYLSVSRCILKSYEISFGFNHSSHCQQEVRTVVIRVGQLLLLEVLHMKHLYLSFSRPQMLFARQAGLPTGTSVRKLILSQPCCNVKLMVWF